jgi:hypothetical protein
MPLSKFIVSMVQNCSFDDEYTRDVKITVLFLCTCLNQQISTYLQWRSHAFVEIHRSSATSLFPILPLKQRVLPLQLPCRPIAMPYSSYLEDDQYLVAPNASVQLFHQTHWSICSSPFSSYSALVVAWQPSITLELQIVFVVTRENRERKKVSY